MKTAREVGYIEKPAWLGIGIALASKSSIVKKCRIRLGFRKRRR